MRPLTMRAFAPLAVLTVLALVLPMASIAPAQADARPNIVLIVTDDLDAALVAKMPHIRTLLRDRGTSFANFFVPIPACCPSRTSILRGQYPHNHGVLRNEPPKGGFQAFRNKGYEQSNVATWLHEAGYRTALVGKYLNEYDEVAPRHVPPGWDRWYAWAGLGKYYDYRLNENGKFVDYGHQEGDYETTVLTRHARDFVKQAGDKPFFLYIAPPAPHEPNTPPPRYEGKFDRIKAPRSPSFNEADVSDKPRWLRREPRLGPRLIDEIDALYRRRLRSLRAVDDMVKTLVDTLQSTGELENTYILFTSDNGYHLGEHRIPEEKGTPYEEAIRVPLLVRGPGVAAGRTETRLASNIDLAPTFAALAGPEVELPDFVDGRSLVPLLDGDQGMPWRQAVLVEFGARAADETGEVGIASDGEKGVPGAAPNPATFWKLRTTERAYVEYKRGERELYDLAADPYELENLANDRARADEIASLHAWLQALRGCAGQGCRDAEDAPPAT